MLRRLRQWGKGGPPPDAGGQGEEGAQLVEYVLLVVLIVLVAMVAVKFFGQKASTQYSNIADTIGEVM